MGYEVTIGNVSEDSDSTDTTRNTLTLALIARAVARWATPAGTQPHRESQARVSPGAVQGPALPELGLLPALPETVTQTRPSPLSIFYQNSFIQGVGQPALPFGGASLPFPLPTASCLTLSLHQLTSSVLFSKMCRKATKNTKLIF